MFGKIFTQVYDSSIAEDYLIRLVFQDFVILADVNGVVDMTQEAISRRTNVPLEIVTRAISALEKPDPRSRTPDSNGARIVLLDSHRDWGWMVVNYNKFREIASEDQRREKTKLRVRKFRQVSLLEECNAPVTLTNAGNAKHYASASASSTGLGVQGKGVSPEEIYEAYPRKVARKTAIISIRQAITKSKIESTKLLDIVKAYAIAVENMEQRYVPHPATWFNQERFYDDPSTWKTYENRSTQINRPTASQGPNRNAGTYNEGHESDYRYAAINSQKPVPDVPDVRG